MDYLLLHLLTLIANLVVLVTFVRSFNSIKIRHDDGWVAHHREWVALGLTAIILIFYHISAVKNTEINGTAGGYEWICMNLQVVAMYYGVIYSEDWHVTAGIALIVTVWFSWMPHVLAWHGFNYGLVIVLGLIAFFRHFATYIRTHRILYYLGQVVIVIPFYAVNLDRLHTVGIGWPFLITSLLITVITVRITTLNMERLWRKAQAIEYAAMFDGATGLKNFRTFSDALVAAHKRFGETGELYGLFALDIDHFKRINDTHGHIDGNTVLRCVGQELIQIADDMPYRADVFRTGGEEFTVLLYNVVQGEAAAADIARTLRERVAALVIPLSGADINVTVSIGGEVMRAGYDNYLEVYKAADKYLYTSKQNGRNAITLNNHTFR